MKEMNDGQDAEAERKGGEQSTMFGAKKEMNGQSVCL